MTHRRPTKMAARYAIAAALWLAGTAHAQGCSFVFESGAGPFDYRSERQMLHVVERRHFTFKVERLASGETTKTPGPDLDYTLAKFPNHHRALMTVARYGEKLRTPFAPDMLYPVDCYFERALHLTPDDTVVRLIFAQHLGKTDRKRAALGQLRMAQTYAEGRPLTHYNIGLVAVELGEFDLALESAHAAEQMGYAQPALREALEKAGRWREPAAEQPAAASASASAAASAASSP